jgi:3-phenylpropionate/cinnamic acid dioxygenase small subunit
MDDRQQIYNVLVRYAEGIDRRDFDAVATCFTVDADASYGGKSVGPGVGAILEFLRHGVESSLASTHLVGNLQIEIDGDRATSVSAVIAVHVVDRAEEGTRVLIRGLRYHDQLKRVDSGWRIAERVHEQRWMADCAGQVLSSGEALPGGRA